MIPVYGRFFDGESGQRLDVDLHIDQAAETLRLAHPDLPHGSQYWPLRAIRALADQARSDRLVLSLYDDGALDSALITTARLTVEDYQTVQELKRLCVNLNRRDLKRGTGRKVAVYTGGALAAFAAMIFVIIPMLASTLAAFIPLDKEIAFGKSVVGSMESMFGRGREGSLVCTGEEGMAALQLMEDRLLATTDTIYDLNVLVFDHPMVNAFAAPGGQIVIMRGLIDKAGSADEVAAVLAHEIGHVEARDVTRNALRVAGSAGLVSMMFGDFTGGSAMVIVAEQVLNSSYTREAEAAADTYAREMLAAADVSTEGMANFFGLLANLSDNSPKMPVFLSSHPETTGRAEAARDFAQTQRATRPILADREWAQLRTVCD